MISNSLRGMPIVTCPAYLDELSVDTRIKLVTSRLFSMNPAMRNRFDRNTFFSTAYSDRLSYDSVYSIFRGCLRKSGSSHRGRGKGPRVHDFSHPYVKHTENFVPCHDKSRCNNYTSAFIMIRLFMYFQ